MARARSRAVLSPAELSRARGAARVRVGGRVASVDTGGAVIADALGAVSARFRAAPTQTRELTPGELVIVEGRPSRRGLLDARVIERHPAPLPRGDGEHARLAWQGVGPRLALRSRALAAVREYFHAESFLEVETPLRVPAPGVDLYVDALRAEGGYLVTSPELHMKRLVVGGLPRIYQIARAHRAEELGPLHEPAFTLVEWYRAFAGLGEVLRDTERLVARVARAVSGRAELRYRGRVIDARPPFEQLTVREAFRRYAGIRDATLLEESRYFELLVERVEPALARASRPIFLTEYPAAQAALARPMPGDASVAERFELYAAGVELSNGFGELTDPLEQRRRFRAERARRREDGRRVYPLDERFLAALREGMPPAGGNALGFDRLLMLAAGADDIAAVLAFPAARA
ncbi:MAG: EF-P lysine aminoacylase EpmA [Sorangiineae bacterium]|nr:EF-P lysine aminoacylase EpmA [Polyangiaceae bacterium]MEB2324669.1 EF-P lysine aminoacylase EpmA [Sorangiineae bacterium]